MATYHFTVDYIMDDGNTREEHGTVEADNLEDAKTLAKDANPTGRVTSVWKEEEEG